MLTDQFETFIGYFLFINDLKVFRQCYKFRWGGVDFATFGAHPLPNSSRRVDWHLTVFLGDIYAMS